MKQALLCALVLASRGAAAREDSGAPKITVGSKSFTESVILGEIVAQMARWAGARVDHRRELGGTKLLWSALLAGDVDVYPEYTGTIVQEILGKLAIHGDEAIRSALAERGIAVSGSLGFNNTYAIGMREAVADQLGIRTISDLARHPELQLGFSNEFMDRADGWPALRARYRLPQRNVSGVDHDVAYRGLESGAIDAMDLYSTDAEIRYYRLRVLQDDLHVFPEYRAVLLHRVQLKERAPDVLRALSKLEGAISEDEMMAMNAQVKLDRKPEARVAAEFLREKFGIEAEVREERLASRVLRHLQEHLFLVSLSLLAAIAVSLPLGVMAARFPRLGEVVLGAVGIIQTIPSLALLVFMIPFLGIGARPSIVALFLYSLLPIVRNTFSGLRGIAIEIRESAEALGLPRFARLRLIELPIASPSILAGVKTSAVINVGTATLGALIGAGGFGQPILTGIRLNDVGLILEGAVPAAALALLVQGIFELAERALVPKGLRGSTPS